MAIKNKFLRFITSVFISLFSYFLIALNFEGNPLETMFVFAVFGFFIVVPFLSFMVYIFYILLTKKGERSKRAPIIIRRMLLILSVIILLYLTAQFTDLLDNL